MASKHPQGKRNAVCAICGRKRSAGVRCREITSLEVASIAFVWSAATPLPDFRMNSGQKPGPTLSTIWRKRHEKDVKFSTRMASTDREAIKELAKQSGMSMSDYVTACCLGKQVVVIDGLKEVLKELKSIGRNLNQLVTLAHMGRVTVIDLESVCRAFSELCGAVRMILERKRW